jgi:hypothetical protein
MAILTPKKTNASLVVRREMIHIGDRGGAVREPDRPIWLNSAKGGDPMSHGSAQRSDMPVAEHYR